MGRPRPSGLAPLAITLAVAVVVTACSGVSGGLATPLPTLPPLSVSVAPSPLTAASASASAAAPSPTADPTATPTASPTLLPTDPATASPAPATATWTMDVYDARAVRWQNPDKTACTAASALIMLNMAVYWTDYKAKPGQVLPVRPTAWTPDTTYARQEALLAYQRKTGTMLLSWPGADAHGWRTSLNFYGWGSTGAKVYQDQAFGSFDAAVKATVLGVALYRKPVGILGWAGDHAQIVTGYKVQGGDPRMGRTDFSVVGVYLTDPLQSDGYRDRYITLATWKSGAKTIKFTPYKMTNSPYVDKIDGHQGNAEWDGKWVIVAPVA